MTSCCRVYNVLSFQHQITPDEDTRTEVSKRWVVDDTIQRFIAKDGALYQYRQDWNNVHWSRVWFLYRRESTSKWKTFQVSWEYCYKWVFDKRRVNYAYSSILFCVWSTTKSSVWLSRPYYLNQDQSLCTVSDSPAHIWLWDLDTVSPQH